MEKECSDYLSSQLSVVSDLQKNHLPTIIKVIQKLVECREKGNTIFTMGNGGSASTASHFAADLSKTTINENTTKRFKVHSLCDNVPVLTAWSNDSSYDEIFREQLKNWVTSDDIVLGISGSGNSSNVLNGLTYAKTVGATTITFTGMGGGKASKLSDISLIIPSNHMMSIEDLHLMICHMITTIIYEMD